MMTCRGTESVFLKLYGQGAGETHAATLDKRKVSLAELGLAGIKRVVVEGFGEEWSEQKEPCFLGVEGQAVSLWMMKREPP